MEKVAIDRLRFLDLRGKPTLVTGYFSDRLLLIFHRHLA